MSNKQRKATDMMLLKFRQEGDPLCLRSDHIVGLMLAWGRRERDEAELHFIREICFNCEDEEMPNRDVDGEWGHDWDAPHGPSRSRCDAAPFYELRRRRAEADGE